jgi:hypothetical protein
MLTIPPKECGPPEKKRRSACFETSGMPQHYHDADFRRVRSGPHFHLIGQPPCLTMARSTSSISQMVSFSATMMFW